MNDRTPSVLLVDDDGRFRERLSAVMRARGYRVSATARSTEAVALARAAAPDLAVLATRPPGVDAAALLDELVPLAPAAKIVIVSEQGSIAAAVRCLRRGACDYLSKPGDAERLADALERVDGGDAPRLCEATPSLARVRWEHVQRVLLDTGGNISETARRLGITRRTLQLKLKREAPQA